MPAVLPYKLQAFYDGGCSICSGEVQLIRRWDRRQQILFTDIAAPEFNAAEYGKSQAELMGHMHARLPDGTWITGVEVFRQLYALVGMGVPVAISRLPLVSHLLDLAYAIFARLRLKLPRRQCAAGGCAAG